jgi:hypothetical protein
MKADPDVIAVIDSILAEAGDGRHDVESYLETGYVDPWEPVQGWVDRLRGIRAALEAKE